MHHLLISIIVMLVRLIRSFFLKSFISMYCTHQTYWIQNTIDLDWFIFFNDLIDDYDLFILMLFVLFMFIYYLLFIRYLYFIWRIFKPNMFTRFPLKRSRFMNWLVNEIPFMQLAHHRFMNFRLSYKGDQIKLLYVDNNKKQSYTSCQ